MSDTGAATEGPESRSADRETDRDTDRDTAPATGRPVERARRGELSKNPHPSVSRAALAAQYPSWGLATMGLLAVGVLVGYLSLGTLASSVDQCAQSPGLLVCRHRVHAIAVALPVFTLIIGLAVSLIGGRVVLRRGGPPLLAPAIGWAVFLVGTVVAYVLAGIL
ncbi:MAG: hypothetical protein QOK26_1340 [Pseudonocardiales bacterium]|nr:hypothetical protein [Pseudonocardiales bacterium]